MSAASKWLLGGLGAVVLIVVLAVAIGPRTVQENLAEPDPDPEPADVVAESEGRFCMAFVGKEAAPGLTMAQRVADENLHWTIPLAEAPTQELADAAWTVWTFVLEDNPMALEAATEFDRLASIECQYEG